MSNSSKPKIIVLKLREIIYTIIFIILAVLLIIILIYMFSSDEDESVTTNRYISGVYKTSLILGGDINEVVVTVDANHIKNVSINNLEETIDVSFPIMKSTITNINNQLSLADSVDEIQYTDDMYYTYNVLLESINVALSKASN